MKEIVLAIALAFIMAVYANPLQICEVIDNDVICQCQGYNLTYFPNDRFSSQSRAKIQFSQFENLIKTNCSPFLVPFLCSRYFPPCNPSWHIKYILPCRELCQRVRSDCEQILKRYGAKWSQELSCDAFQSVNDTQSTGVPCISIESITATSADEECKIKEKCVDIEHAKGKSASYKTYFPNVVATSQTIASQKLNNILKKKCSLNTEQFFILSHYPPCREVNDTVQLLYPCKQLCRRIKKECEEQLGSKVTWPDYMDCRKFSKEACVDDMSSYFVKPSPTQSATQLPTTTPTPKPLKSCKQVIETSCGELNEFSSLPKIEFPEYKSTYAQYVNLLNSSCSMWLKPFLCYEAFSAHKSTDTTKRINPCRNVCRKAENDCSTCFTKLGFSWSDHWNCQDFQVKKDCIGVNELKSYSDNVKIDSSSCPEAKDDKVCTP